jgi:hypothetical protein
MKKALLLSLIAASIITLSFSIATTEFEGKINYEITIDGSSLPPEAMAMFEGSELNVYIKGTKSRSEVSMGFQNTTTISDTKTNSSVMLMEMMGNKYKIKSNPQKDEKPSDVSVKYLDETKEIAGYKCKKAQITFKDKSASDIVTNIYFTEEISNYMGNDSRSSQFKEIKGMPLEYEMKAERGMKLKMTAKTVSKEKISDSKFDIPSDYKETTVEEMQKEMMKMMRQGGERH